MNAALQERAASARFNSRRPTHRETLRSARLRWRVENLNPAMARHGLKHTRLLLYVPGTPYSADVWAENAGVLAAAQDPKRLSAIVLRHGLRGLDYTHADFLFEPDAVTPNAIAQALGEAFAALRHRTTPTTTATDSK